jgi:predicted nucleotidyltransferase
LQSVELVFGMRKVLELAHKAGPEYLDDILSSIVYEAVTTSPPASTSRRR